MRPPTRIETYFLIWGTAGVALVFTIIVAVSHASIPGIDLLSFGIAVMSGAVFLGGYGLFA